MKIIVGCFFGFFISFLFANDLQEMTLDKLKNKKIVKMDEKEFEEYLNKQEKLKQKIEQKKESNAKSKVTEYKMVEVTIKKDDEQIASPTVITEKKNNNEVVENNKKENKATLEAKNINKQIETKKEDSALVKKDVEKETNTAQLDGNIEKLSKMDLENSISFLLQKINELSVYEFEQSKSIILEKITKDNRFDKDVLHSMNVSLLNKIEFFDFLREVKNAIKQR